MIDFAKKPAPQGENFVRSLASLSPEPQPAPTHPAFVKNAKLLDWVAEIARLARPADIHWCDGSQSEVVYEGQDFLSFGYKAFGIAMSNGEWNIHGVDADEANAFAMGETASGVVDSNELVDLNFSTP